jgi:hypothetical protein
LKVNFGLGVPACDVNLETGFLLQSGEGVYVMSEVCKEELMEISMLLKIGVSEVPGMFDKARSF